MDIRLEKALEFANYMNMLNNQKRILKEKFLENTVHYLNGGKFTVTKELINFCNTLLTNNQTEVILLDDNDTPVQIDNLQKFFQDLIDIYVQNTNSYFTEYTKLKNKRYPKGLVDL
jgi:hypothetical protein